MAYNFASTNRVEFAIAPFNGTTFGAITMAMFLRRGATSSLDLLIDFTDSALSDKTYMSVQTGGTNLAGFVRGASAAATPSSIALSNTSIWYLLAVTIASGTATPRFHLHDGTSWTHQNGATGTISAASTISGTDRLIVGSQFSGAAFVGDIVCCGVKKADSSDATIETLTRTAFSSWVGFGFDWLIGFDSSLESGGILQDQASPGTGDEIAISGTTAVADPAGWSFATAVTPVANFTATPLSGTTPLSVTFTDTSTNTPTSWAWDFGDGGTSTSQNPSHSYTTSGVYTVALTATNAAGSDTKTRAAYITVGETITYVQPYWVAGGQIDIW